MRPSLTAAYRFYDLWPDKTIAIQFAASRRVGKKTKQRILQTMKPRHAQILRKWSGLFLTKSPCGCVFICTPKHFIVDVMTLPEPPK